ncbi:MAG: UDP-N-acetylenolpyruvoylglucosamine reductase [Deltaproteobacteria bacterium]|nr:MAG: UDP-N-acetylenolpyruvoylglucosamine reductase [Deltaproteobacteria bacterium]
MNSLYKQIADKFGDRASFNRSLKDYNTFHIGGKADVVVSAENTEEVSWLLNLVKANNLAWRVIGRGSNLLVPDRGFPGIILILGGSFKQMSVKGRLIEAGAGCCLTKFIKWCQQQGLGGGEFLFGIPGSVGGAVFMNAGAFGGHIADILTGIEVITPEKTAYYDQDELRYSYRRLDNWSDMGMAVIARAWFACRPDDPAMIRERCVKLIRKRQGRQPYGMPSAGSFFKNPQGDSAGRLIDVCGLKGFRVGDAMISKKHANFLVNAGQASSEDVVRLMEIVQKEVEYNSGVSLEPEVRFI